MILTDTDMVALTTLHGGTTEYQDAQCKLFATGHRWCPACHTVLPTKYFHKIEAMALGLDSRCKLCTRAKRRRTYVKLSNPTRLARFFKRHPRKRPSSTRGPYGKTQEAREAGEYIVDPLHGDLWLASPH